MTDELELLSRYHDGEVEPAERVRVAAMLMRDIERRRSLDLWRAIGDGIRQVSRAPSEHADSIEQHVISRIESMESTHRNPRRVGWRNVARLTLAAGFLLAIGYGADRRLAATPCQAVTHGALKRLPVKFSMPVAWSHLPGVSSNARPPLAIERVDLGARSGAIFLVSAGELETPVVWLNDDEHGGRIRNL